MADAYHIHSFSFGGQQLQLCVPDEIAVREKYTADQDKGIAREFPYWAKAWPASIALCDYLAAHPEILKGKMVLELAAGLALPSLLAARYATKVICSDYQQAALDLVQQSVILNNIQNLECRLIDWSHYPAHLEADIVLLSDVNYDPSQFSILLELIKSLLNQGTIVILSTPQRIMGKPFIQALLPFCRATHTSCVEAAGGIKEIFIMHLEKAL